MSRPITNSQRHSGEPGARRRQAGFSLIELLVALGLLMVFMGMAFRLFDQLTALNQSVVEVAEVNDNLNAAVTLMTRDLLSAGSGMPTGGIAVGSGSNASPVTRPSWNAQTFPVTNGVLSAIMPGYQLGPVSDGRATDEVTILMVDPQSPVYPLSKITPSGSQVTIDNSINLSDPAQQINTGDLLMLSNANGNVLGMATNVIPNSNKVLFAASDPLNINQPSASHGNIASLQNAGSNTYPPTVMYRIHMITYYIDTSGTEPRLMRRINNQAAVEVADDVDVLQFTYDYDDPASGDLLTDQPTVAAPNQIRQVHLLVEARSQRRLRQSGQYLRRTLSTSVAARNLSYKNRYQ